jgi:Ras-related protein Rab-5C
MGPSSSGKTSIIQRFVKGKFHDQEPTIGTAFYTREVETSGMRVPLKIWDTAGMERYRSLVPKYSRGAAIAVIVFDVTDRESLRAAQDIVVDTPTICDPDTVAILVANKIDLPTVVDLQLASEFAEEHHAVFAQTSAKTGENVSELFDYIAGRVAECELTVLRHDPAGALEEGNPDAGCCG